MNILCFPILEDEIKQGLAELSDNIKFLVYQEDETLIDFVGFDNDSAFLEPSLFYYLRTKAFNNTPRTNIPQILRGYGGENVSELDVYSDKNGICYLPNLGYAVFEKKDIAHRNIKLDIAKRTLENGNLIPLNMLLSLQNGKFNACCHEPDIFEEMQVHFNENMLSSTFKMLPFCNTALDIIQELAPDYYELIHLTTREFFLFNSSNTESFTALHHFGTVFLNCYNTTPSVISMIEDIAHQCGHTLFYTLTHNSERYLKVPKHTPIKNFTGRDYDPRDVYGAFHGNFTFTTMFHCFDKLMENKGLSKGDELELKARMGFALPRYGIGIQDFDNSDDLLTNEGKVYYNYFVESFEYIKNKYQNEITGFDFSNQPYSFSFEKFKEIN